MELLAWGRDADVFDLGDGTVLRRSRKGIDQRPEARVMGYAAEHGYPVPRVHSVSDDGSDLVMEKVAGPTMVQALERGPWAARRIGAQLAELHDRLHEIDGPEWLRPIGEEAADGDDRLLHFDLHPLNVVLSPDGPVVIDWTNAGRGQAAADVARAWSLIATADADVAWFLRPMVGRVRRSLLDGFLDAAGRDAARPGLASAVGWALRDPNMGEAEKARMRALLDAEGVG